MFISTLFPTKVVIVVYPLSHVQTPCHTIDCSIPGFLVLHYLWEFAQTRVHWGSDAIQPSCPLSSPASAFSLSQHEDLFLWVGSLHQVGQSIGASASAWVLPMNIQGWFPLELMDLILLSQDSQESSPASQLKSISSPKVGCVLYLDTMLQAANTRTDVKKASGWPRPCISWMRSSRSG